MHSRFQPARGHTLPETLEEYLSLFAAAAPEQRAGEASPSYLFSHTAAGRIAELQPAARCIGILREPASFLYSLHHQLLRSHVETEKDLLKAISLEDSRSQGANVPPRSHVPQLLQYSDHVRYTEQVRRYHDALPAEQLLVLIYDDFRADNRRSVGEVLRFIDVDDAYLLEGVEVKQTVRAMRSQQLDDVSRSLTQGRSPLARTSRTMIKALTWRGARHAAFRMLRSRGVFRDVPPLDADLALALRRRYKHEVVALSDYLDRDLVTLWGYDAI
jgi:hypothetical protein